MVGTGCEEQHEQESTSNREIDGSLDPGRRMDHSMRTYGHAADTTRRLERYADRSRPPAPRVYVATGLVLGAVIASFGVLPSVWGERCWSSWVLPGWPTTGG